MSQDVHGHVLCVRLQLTAKQGAPSALIGAGVAPDQFVTDLCYFLADNAPSNLCCSANTDGSGRKGCQ